MDFRAKTDVRASDNIREELMPFVQSQYSASSKILHILSTFRNEMDPRRDYLLFYKMIFDISTAEGIGLDIWGRIVAIKRDIEDPVTGFSITLDDENYRVILMYKALANIMQATIPSLTRLIDILFPNNQGIVIVVEQYVSNEQGIKYNQKPMHIRWVFGKFFDNIELAVFRVAGTLCRGAGVEWGLYAIDPSSVFGFDGSGLQPFNQGIFDPIGVIGG